LLYLKIYTHGYGDPRQRSDVREQSDVLQSPDSFGRATLIRKVTGRLVVELEVTPGAVNYRSDAELALAALPAISRACSTGEIGFTITQRTYDPARSISLRSG
jgi:hypothetical protein